MRTDGALARALRVSERLPWFNGAKLDDIIDYLTYVFVPALFVWRAILVPETWIVYVTSAMLLSSAYGFNRDDAKTEDHFFTGFPSYWNIVVFYLMVLRLPDTVNGVILLALAAMVFVPLRYVYPSRTPVLRLPTNVLAAIWGVLIGVMLWQYPAISTAGAARVAGVPGVLLRLCRSSCNWNHEGTNGTHRKATKINSSDCLRLVELSTSCSSWLSLTSVAHRAPAADPPPPTAAADRRPRASCRPSRSGDRRRARS